jgi:hypothetical protein
MATSITPDVLYQRSRGVFDSVDSDCVQNAIDEAVRYVSEVNWGDRYDDGVFYLSCHILAESAMLEQAGTDGGPAATGGAVPAGPVMSESILSWRTTYSVSEGGVFDDGLATTTWGRQYLARSNRVFSRRVL